MRYRKPYRKLCGVAFLLLWVFLLMRLIIQIIKMHSALSFNGGKDWVALIFWAVMSGYCLIALFSLGIHREVPWYGVLAVLLAAGTILLSLAGDASILAE